MKKVITILLFTLLSLLLFCKHNGFKSERLSNEAKRQILLLTGEIGRELWEDEPEKGRAIGGVAGLLAAELIVRYSDKKVSGPLEGSPPPKLHIEIVKVWTETKTSWTFQKVVKTNIKYYVWAPRHDQKIEVEERFNFYKGGKLMLYAPIGPKTRASGTYVASVDFGHGDKLKGVYTMKGSVKAGGKTAECETTFEIK